MLLTAYRQSYSLVEIMCAFISKTKTEDHAVNQPRKSCECQSLGHSMQFTKCVCSLDRQAPGLSGLLTFVVLT